MIGLRTSFAFGTSRGGRSTLIGSRGVESGQVLDFEAVVVLAPLAAAEDRLGNLFHREIAEGIHVLGSIGAAQHKQAALVADFFTQPSQLLTAQGLSGDVDKIVLGSLSVLPIGRLTGRVAKPFEFADRLGEHGGIVFFTDNPIAEGVLFEQRRGQMKIAQPPPLHAI